MATEKKHGAYETVRDFIKLNPFVSVLGVWGSVLGGTIAYLYNRPIPMQLKIIQGRIVAQGALLSGAGLAAAHHFLYEEGAGKGYGKDQADHAQGHMPRVKYRDYSVKYDVTDADVPSVEEGGAAATATAKPQG